MFGILSVFTDVLQTLASKKPGSSSNTKSSPAEPLTAEPAVKPAKPPAQHAEPPAKHTEPPPNAEPAPKLAEPPAKHAEPPAKHAKSATKPDDLRRIEGIGPKISSVLVEAGITTFSQLAASQVEQLREILAAAGLGPLADPSSWPEQARLAAAEDWEAFQKLKDELEGGRRR